MDTPRLSLVAQFDDICRQLSSFINQDIFANALIQLLKQIDGWRQDCLYAENETKSWKDKFEKLEQDHIALQRTLKNVRECYKRETTLREKVSREKDLLYNKLCQVRDLLRDDYSERTEKAREKVLSCLDINLETVKEMDESNEEILSDDNFDFSEENNLDESRIVTLKRASKITENAPPPKKSREPTDFEKDMIIVSKEILTPLHENRTSNLFTKKIGSQTSVMFNSQKQLPQRKHNFAAKKCFKANEKCTACGNNIGFYSNCFRCSDCRACTHTQCKGNLPLPCIPYVSKDKIGKQGRLVTISDYVPLNSRPAIPALLIHCCAAIEKKNGEEGLYRIPGNDREVKSLKDKILKSKTGIPPLEKVEAPVLCSVVKDFLIQLDEPLLTRVLWRDFVDAAKIEDDEDRVSYICSAIGELPLANRHTLAFFMIHLQKVASSTSKMTKESLARVFGPTIVGYSSSQPITVGMFAENQSQIRVMEVLLNLPEEYWIGVVNDFGNNESRSPIETVGKRQSIGGKVIGGSLHSESFAKEAKRRVKPLF